MEKENFESIFQKIAPEKRKVIRGLLEPVIGDDYFILPTTDGPPGTGKTFTAAIAASLYVKENPERNRVIFLAYTNYALDRVKEELDKWFNPKQVIRLKSDTRVKDWEKGIIGCDFYLSGLSGGDISRLREQPFLICTPFMLGRLKRVGVGRKNTLVIFDEFSQIDPTTFFMALDRLSSINPNAIALFGDPLQLPVVTTQQDLLPNIINFLGDLNINTFKPYRLIYQFRMNESICSAVNVMRKELSRFTPVSSGHQLIPDDSIRHKTLLDDGYKWDAKEAKEFNSNFYLQPGFDEILDPKNPLVVIDTSELSEEKQSPTGSKYNVDEAELVADIAKAASRSLTLPTKESCRPTVITPYSAQSLQIKYLLQNQFGEVLTVYKAQGREYPFVIVSFVRNNRRGDIGFLGQEYLQGQGYVAISRAQRKLIVLISESTFGIHPVFDSFLKMGDETCLKVKAKKK